MMRLQEELAGNRFLRGMIIPGGVSMDILGAAAVHSDLSAAGGEEGC